MSNDEETVHTESPRVVMGEDTLNLRLAAWLRTSSANAVVGVPFPRDEGMAEALKLVRFMGSLQIVDFCGEAHPLSEEAFNAFPPAIPLVVPESISSAEAESFFAERGATESFMRLLAESRSAFEAREVDRARDIERFHAESMAPSFTFPTYPALDVRRLMGAVRRRQQERSGGKGKSILSRRERRRIAHRDRMKGKR